MLGMLHTDMIKTDVYKYLPVNVKKAYGKSLNELVLQLNPFRKI